MGYNAVRAPHVGSWLSDAVGWVTDHAGITGGGPPGGGTRPQQLTWYQYGDAGDYVTSDDADDLDTVLSWRQYCYDTGVFPTVMPSGRSNAGELAYRLNGPGTSQPNAQPPFTYTLAPDDVRQAYARIRAKESLQKFWGALIPKEVIPLNDALQGALSFFDQYKWWLLAGVGAVVIVPRLLPAVQAFAPRRRR